MTGYDRGYGSARPGTAPTARELEVFAAVVREASIAGAARALGIRHRTVTSHLCHLYNRIEAENRAHAAALLFRAHGATWTLAGKS